MKRQLQLSIATLFLTLLLGAQEKEFSYKPKEGYVPNAETAKRIAEAVWIPIYGEKQIQNEKPFKVGLHDGVWTVRGSLPPMHVGGVAEIAIAKDDGRILRVSHGK